MKTLLLIILHVLLFLGCFMGLVGSAKEYVVPIVVQEILCMISSAGFLFFFWKTNNVPPKMYFGFLILIGLYFIIDGFVRLFFEHRLMDFF